MNFKFNKAIDGVKNNGIVINQYGDKPVILKHNDGDFEEISSKEMMEIFNENYSGENVYSICDVASQLVKVDVANYKKR